MAAPCTQDAQHVLVDQVSRILSSHRGPQAAITLADMAAAVGTSRREMETLIEHSLDRFPFPVAAGSRGYYVVTNADQVNAYLSSLRGREFALYRRVRTLRHKATAAGFRRVGNAFEDPPSRQPELFEFHR